MSLIFFGRIAQALLALVALRVMTTMLPPEEVGRWSLLVAMTSLFVLGLINPLGMFINRRLHSWVEGGKIFFYFKYYFFYLLGVALFASLVIYISSFFYIVVPGIPMIWVILLLIVSIIFATLNQTFIPSLNLLEYRGLFVVMTLATVGLSLLSSVSFAYWLSPKAEYWQLGQLVGQFVFAVIGGLVFFNIVKQHQGETASSAPLSITKDKVMRLIAFTLPLAFSVLLTWMQSQSFKFIVQDIIGLKALGIFIVGYGVAAAVIAMIESIISTYFIPIFYKRVSSGDTEEHALAWNHYAMVMFVSVVLTVGFIIAVSDQLAVILLDSSFYQARHYVIWGALAEAARVIVGVYALLAHAGMETKRLVLPNFIAALSAPIVIYMLTVSLGVDGVGVGLVIGGVIAILASHLFLAKNFILIMPWRAIFRAGGIAVLFVGCAELLKYFLNASDTWIISLLWVSGMGLTLLATLYLLLKESVTKESV